MLSFKTIVLCSSFQLLIIGLPTAKINTTDETLTHINNKKDNSSDELGATNHDPSLVFSSITKVLSQGLNPYTTGAIKADHNHDRFMKCILLKLIHFSFGMLSFLVKSNNHH